jgi:hypothetical protein
MIIHHDFVMTEPGLQVGAHHPHSFLSHAHMFRLVPKTVSLVAFGVQALTLAPSLDAQTAGSVRYTFSSTSVVRLERAPQTPLVDTILTKAIVAVDLSHASDTIATLRLDSLVASSTGLVRRGAGALDHGISVSVSLTAGRPRVTGDSATACAIERPLIGMLPELIPLLPAQLGPNLEWTDTTTVTSCRAGLIVTTHAITVYRTLSAMDSTSLLLERRSTLSAIGAASVRAQSVTLQGTGTAESLAVVDVLARRVQQLRGTQELRIQLTNGQQTREMVQQITDVVTRHP